MKVTPHIKSRHRLFKDKYIAIKEAKNGGASGFGWDEYKQQIVADDDVYQSWAKRFRGAKGLNKRPFPYYDQLARIFGLDRAVGGESEHLAPVAVNDASEQIVDAPSAFDDEASQRVLESLINQGIDGRNMEAATSKASKRPRKDVLASGMTDEIAKLHPCLRRQRQA
ncbi:hypothetical protein LINPERPRIM_LOCUS24811 [Linum perenne]